MSEGGRGVLVVCEAKYYEGRGLVGGEGSVEQGDGVRRSSPLQPSHDVLSTACHPTPSALPSPTCP